MRSLLLNVNTRTFDDLHAAADKARKNVELKKEVLEALLRDYSALLNAARDGGTIIKES